ncbi:hypothetical protein FQZ97_664700 [compost metagenome]
MGKCIEMTDDEYIEIMRKADEARLEYCQEQAAKNAVVLDQVRGMVSSKVFKQIEAEISESGETFDYEIVAEPAGHPQDNGYSLGDVYVDQTCGHCGDDFSGTVALPLPDGRYLQFGFAC